MRESVENKWSKEEIDFLVENYPKIGPLKCSEKINRTVRGCQLKAKKLNLKFKQIKNYYEKENLEKVIIESNSYTDCLKKIGLSNRPGNYDTLKKYIGIYRLDISHNNNGIDNTTAELMHKWANIIGIRILVFHYTVYFQQESHAILFKLRWS
jgi:hypothetical protein